MVAVAAAMAPATTTAPTQRIGARARPAKPSAGAIAAAAATAAATTISTIAATVVQQYDGGLARFTHVVSYRVIYYCCRLSCIFLVAPDPKQTVFHCRGEKKMESARCETGKNEVRGGWKSCQEEGRGHKAG